MLPTQIKNMGVRHMTMIETGRYQPMFYRPYEVNADGAVYKNMIDRLAGCPDAASAGALSGIASQMLMPSAMPQGQLLIPNDWNERRIRFMLAIEFEYITGTRGTYWIQGYTTYTGVSASGFVDPKMVLFANSCTTTTQTPVPTPFGIQMNEVIRDSVQILTGPNTDIFNSSNNLYAMRPEDIYMNMQVSQMMAGSDLNRLDIKDTRAITNFTPFTSKREHNVPTDYLGRMIGSYFKSREAVEFGAEGRDLLTSAIGLNREKSLRENMFFQYISGRHPGMSFHQFTMEDLQSIDPGIAQKVMFFKLSEVMRVNNTMPIPDGGNSEHWQGCDLTTQMASMLAEAVPSMMLQSLLSVVSFRSTNHDIGGQHSMVFMNLKSISNVEAQTLAKMFQKLFEQHVLPDLTMNGMMPYMLDMTCDISGDTWITLQLDANPALTFSVPSFCDSLFAPVLTNNLNHFHDTTVKLDHMLNYISTEVLDQPSASKMLTTHSLY
jgi:hypothetical protein